jgi:hypothetical protein
MHQPRHFSAAVDRAQEAFLSSLSCRSRDLEPVLPSQQQQSFRNSTVTLVSLASAVLLQQQQHVNSSNIFPYNSLASLQSPIKGPILTH